jgi:hypothetical protein
MYYWLPRLFFRNVNSSFCCRFFRQQPRMDAVEDRPGPPVGDSWFAVFWKIGAGPSLPNRVVHAGRVAGRGPVQEGNPRRQSELSVADQGRRRTSGTAGITVKRPHFAKVDEKCKSDAFALCLIITRSGCNRRRVGNRVLLG